MQTLITAPLTHNQAEAAQERKRKRVAQQAAEQRAAAAAAAPAEDSDVYDYDYYNGEDDDDSFMMMGSPETLNAAGTSSSSSAAAAGAAGAAGTAAGGAAGAGKAAAKPATKQLWAKGTGYGTRHDKGGWDQKVCTIYISKQTATQPCGLVYSTSSMLYASHAVYRVHTAIRMQSRSEMPVSTAVQPSTDALELTLAIYVPTLCCMNRRTCYSNWRKTGRSRRCSMH